MFRKISLVASIIVVVAGAATAQSAGPAAQVMPMDIDARVLAHITSGQQIHANAQSAAALGRALPGRPNPFLQPKQLAADMTRPNAIPAGPGAKLARLRSYAGPQGNTNRRPREVCNSDVNIGSIVSDGDIRITGPVRQQVYTGDITVLNLNRCRAIEN